MKNFIFSKSLFLVVLLSFFALATDPARFLRISQSMENFAAVYKIVNQTYVDETDPNQLMRVAIDSMLAHIDPYTNYFSEAQMVQVKMGVKGGWDGIGVELMKKKDKIVVKELIEGTPAEKMGIRVGDVLLKIDGTSFEDRALEDISKSLQGKAGTKVSIDIRHAASQEVRNLTIERVNVTKKNVPYYGMLNDETGYIILTTFSQRAGANVQRAFEELKNNNDLKHVILDLRDNGGGFLMEAVNICNVFLDKGQEIVYTKNKIPEWNRSFKTLNRPIDTDIPVVVLINGNSASASEIVAGALQDMDRALLIGNNSFGKGLVQNTKDIGYSSKVKLTTAKYYIPSGRCVQALNYKNGIPVKVPDSLRQSFTTKKGKQVFDGKGVEPDFAIDSKPKSALLTALEKENLIFDFANLYREKNDSIAAAKVFEITPKDYQSFQEFAEESWFSFETASEKSLQVLRQQAKKEGTYERLSASFEALQTQIDQAKKEAFVKEYEPIKQQLEQAIVHRYYFQKGQVENRLADDIYVKKALALFADSVQFEQLLWPNNKATD